jgi:hypothetical protein
MRDLTDREEVLRERLAALCHEQWSGWMQYLFGQCDFSGDDVVITRRAFHRWQRQMKTPYAALPEDEKESDREEADRILAVLRSLPYARLQDGEPKRDLIDREAAIRLINVCTCGSGPEFRPVAMRYHTGNCQTHLATMIRALPSVTDGQPAVEAGR